MVKLYAAMRAEGAKICDHASGASSGRTKKYTYDHSSVASKKIYDYASGASSNIYDHASGDASGASTNIYDHK